MERPQDEAAGAAAWTRRAWLAGACASLLPSAAAAAAFDSPQALLDDLERRSFRFLWETTDPRTGLATDRYPTPSFSSIAAVGFALTALPVGAERGWITRAQGAERALATLQFLRDAPQGPEPVGKAGYRGFFYHFIDYRTGTRFAQCELSTIDTAVCLMGALACRVYFDGNEGAEPRIRALADELVGRVDWAWAQPRKPLLSKGWLPESGFIREDWNGYDEATFLYLLALGAGERAIGAEAWAAWTSTYDRQWGGRRWGGQPYLQFAPLFGHQFVHCWVDLKGLRDRWMRQRGLDYFENSRRATYAQRAYAMANPEGWAGYGPNVWGITACDGPADVKRVFNGRLRKFISYGGRGMGGAAAYDDGTIAPYAAGSSLPFAPEIALPALVEMHRRWGHEIYGEFGFFAFNPSFTFKDAKLRHGRIAPGVGWVNTDWLGIEVGPLLAMLANHRDGLLWKLLRDSTVLRRGLERADFQGGWLT